MRLDGTARGRKSKHPLQAVSAAEPIQADVADKASPCTAVKDVKDKAKSLVKKATSSDTPKAVASKAKEAVDKTKAAVTEKVQAVTDAVASEVGRRICLSSSRLKCFP